MYIILFALALLLNYDGGLGAEWGGQAILIGLVLWLWFSAKVLSLAVRAQAIAVKHFADEAAKNKRP